MGRPKNWRSMFVNASEWKEMGGKSVNPFGDKQQQLFLSWDCCCLSCQPCTTPMMSPDGFLFDLDSIIPYVQKYSVNPCTGRRLLAKDLIQLNFKKNAEGKVICPVSEKVFTNKSKIAAIKKTGNVFSNDVVETMVLQPKRFIDPLTNEPIEPSDVVVLHDPENLKDISKFYHTIEGEGEEEEENEEKEEDDAQNKEKPKKTKKDKGSNEKESKDAFSAYYEEKLNPNTTTRNILKTLKEKEDVRLKEEAEKQKKIEEENEKLENERKKAAEAEEKAAMKASGTGSATSITKGAFGKVKLVIDYPKREKGVAGDKRVTGNIILRLETEKAPITCENFIGLCQKGYYDDTIFHRLIPKFMIQGGDPSGTGRGGESLWGKKFEDEFHPSLKHSEKGILSMANSGKNTNGSQFFITFGPAPHLDGKHTVFGHVIEGINVLNDLENVETSKGDSPTSRIVIKQAMVLYDPLKAKKKQDEIKTAHLTVGDIGGWFSNPMKHNLPQQTFGAGIGKYINPKLFQQNQNVKPTQNLKRKENPNDHKEFEPQKKKQKKGNEGFGDFSGW